jgi:hypothetical protein
MVGPGPVLVWHTHRQLLAVETSLLNDQYEQYCHRDERIAVRRGFICTPPLTPSSGDGPEKLKNTTFVAGLIPAGLPPSNLRSPWSRE